MADRSTKDRCIGLDLGDRYSQYVMLNREGGVIESTRIRTNRDAIQAQFASGGPARVALEAGTHSPWVSRLLEELGHEVYVANSRKLALISRSTNKDDRQDAETLARLARSDVELLFPLRHRSAETQVDLALIRARDTLVQARTQLVNHVRGAVKSFGDRLEAGSPRSFPNRVMGQMPEELQPALSPLLGTIEQLNGQIRDFDRQIERLGQEKYPQTGALRQVKGVGPLTALAYVLILEDPHRFRRSRTVGAYLGLRPKRHASGDRAPELSITKTGDQLLRRLLVTSAHYVLGPFGPDTALRQWGQKLAGRGRKNAKKRALVAVARKLAVVLHRLWITGEVYQPFPGPAEPLRV